MSPTEHATSGFGRPWSTPSASKSLERFLISAPGQTTQERRQPVVLDEPSNDLDVATLRSLEDGLINFGGCAVVISHDRWFLDRIATHILSFEGDSEVVWFEGNYQAYHEWRQKTMGDKAQPHRVHYRPLRH